MGNSFIAKITQRVSGALLSIRLDPLVRHGDFIMTKIKFSHLYKKLLERDCVNCLEVIKEAQLLMARIIDIESEHSAFIKYDTEGVYPLPKKGAFILLLFKKPRDSDLFTTIRRYTPQKYDYYRKLVGQKFEIVLNV